MNSRKNGLGFLDRNSAFRPFIPFFNVPCRFIPRAAAPNPHRGHEGRLSGRLVVAFFAKCLSSNCSSDSDLQRGFILAVILHLSG